MAYYERNLPHWQLEGKPIFLTWRLSGSLPHSALASIAKLHGDPSQQFVATEKLLGRVFSGPRWLANPEIAELVERALRRGQQLGQFEMRAWVVMPNHVHVLVEPSVSIRTITRGIKGITAREANRILSRAGQPFWQGESFDRWVRNEAGFSRVKFYIENNPVKAGFVKRPEDWFWSSAHSQGAEK